MTELEIAPMVRPDLDQMIAWAAAEGWNPGVHDADAFWATDPGGFFVARLDGEPIATLSAVRYGESFGFIGFYIVAPHHRGQGHGFALWNAVLGGLGDRVLGLDGVVDQEANYARDGFVTTWRNRRHVLADAVRVAAIDGLPVSTVTGIDLTAVEPTAVHDYDRACFPVPRRAFLEAWTTLPGSHGRAYVDPDGRLRGWGLRRPCNEGSKIGPLVADDEAIADAIFRDLTAGTAGPVFLDIPAPNTAAVELVERYEMPDVFETVRMYRGRPPTLDLDRTYGITTFELG